MGFFRRSGPTLEQCIEQHDYRCVVQFYLKGKSDTAALAMAALLIFCENDSQTLAEILGSLNARDMTNVARAIVESGGPDHPAVPALAGYAGNELGHSLGRAVMRCGEEAYDALVTRTRDEDPNVRLGAITLIGFVGKSGIPALKEIVYHADGEEQRTAARCLQRLEWTPENSGEKPMFFFLCDDWKEIIHLKEQSLPLLLSLVKKDEPVLRKQAIQALGEIGDNRSVSVIMPFVDDPDSKVRIAAVSALARYTSPEIEHCLIRALGHTDSQIRIEVAHALKRKGWTPQARNEHIRYIIASGNWNAVKAFGGMIIPDLIQIVRSRDNEWQGAVHALAEMGSEASRELEKIFPSLPKSQQKIIANVVRKYEEKHRLERENIQKLYHAEGDERQNAARCLQRLGWTPENPEEQPMFFFLCGDWDELIRLKERALPFLFSLVKKDDPALRKNVIQALGRIGDKRAVPAILPYVDDGDHEVRIAAMSALMRYDTPETEQRLVSSLGHMDSQIRIDAAHGLKRKGWTPRTRDEQIRYAIASGNWNAVLKLGDFVIPSLIGIVKNGDNEWPGAVSALAELGPDAAYELKKILPSLPKAQQRSIIRVFQKSEEKHQLRRENIQKLYHTEGDERQKAARCLKCLGWTPENPEEKPMFFFLCGDWDELIRLKEHAIPFLISLVKKDDPALRKRAIQALGKIGDSRAVPAILPHVDDGDHEVRIAAVSALMRYDTPETEQRLVSALGHMDSQIRIDAAHGLKRKGWTPRTRGDQIRYAIASGNWDAVMKLGDPVIPSLIGIVKNGDNEWPGAVYALAGLGSDAAHELEDILPSLPESQQKDILSVFQKSEEKHRLRRENLQNVQGDESEIISDSDYEESKGPTDAEILDAQKRVLEGFKWLRLQKIATEKIYEIIREGVEAHNISFEMAVVALSSKDEAIRATAIDVLSMKGERAYSYIMKAVYDKSEIVRTAVADALGSIGEPSMIKALSILSKDLSVDVRLATVKAFEMMDNNRAFPYIMNMFSDEDMMVRDAAAHAAATYNRFGLPILIQSLNQQDPDVCIAAATALGEIRNVQSLEYLLPHLGAPDSRVRDAIRAAIVSHDYRAIEPLQAYIAEAEGDAKNAALLALYEINPDLAGEGVSNIHMFEEAFATAEGVDAIIGSPAAGEVGASDTGFSSDAPASGEMADEIYNSQNVNLDSRTCEELVLRIDGGDDSLSSALLVDMYDEESSLKSDLISAMRGSDREFAMHSATLLSKIGWSPDGAEEESLFLLAIGRTDDLKKGDPEIALGLLGLVPTMPSSVQNTIVNIFVSIGGREGVTGLARIVIDESGEVSDLAAESLAGMDADAVPFIRDVAASQGGAGKRRLQKIIKNIEGK